MSVCPARILDFVAPHSIVYVLSHSIALSPTAFSCRVLVSSTGGACAPVRTHTYVLRYPTPVRTYSGTLLQYLRTPVMHPVLYCSTSVRTYVFLSRARFELESRMTESCGDVIEYRCDSREWREWIDRQFPVHFNVFLIDSGELS